MAKTTVPIELSSTPSIVDNGNATAITIDSNEHVGVGMTPSAWSTAGKIIQFGNGSPSIGTQNNGDANFMHNAYESPAGTFKYILGGIGALRYNLDINNNVHKWFIAPSGTADNTISFSEAMRIDSSGNVLVGTSTAYGLLAVDAGSGFSSSGVIARFLGTSGNSLLIRGDGDAENTNGNYSAISDEKLKQDITDAGSQWDDIKNLRVRNYKLKSHVETYGDDAPIYIGVIAQEAELVTPNLVKNNPDLDEEQNDLGTVTKSFKYSILYMKAVKALQEAMTRIEDLEARITALENT